MFTSSAYPGSTAWRASSNSNGSSVDPERGGVGADGMGLTPQNLQENHKANVMRALLEKFPQPLRLQVSIPYASAVYSVGGVYVSYCMQLKDEVNAVIWQCSHRYSEYRALHLHLGKNFASGFPPVLLRNKSNRSKKEIEHRRIKLEQYMRKVVSCVLDAYAGNLGRWASQHATKIVSVAAAEAARHKETGASHPSTLQQQRESNNLLSAGVDTYGMAFVGDGNANIIGGGDPVPSTGRLSAVALQQYMAQLQQQRQQQQQQQQAGGVGAPSAPMRHADEQHVDPHGGMAAAEGGLGDGGDLANSANFSALVSMVPATMPPYLAQLTLLLRFIAHPFLDDWENVTFLAAPAMCADDDRLSLASEAIHHHGGGGNVSQGSRSREHSATVSRRSSFDTSSNRSGSTSRTMNSSHISDAPAPHPSAVATRWRAPAVLPGLRLGLSMPLVTVSLSIESVWEAHVKGDKGTKKGQLRHRYDEASAICAHIASKEHIMDSLQMQEFIMEFRRKHPIQAYLRFEKVLENHTPQTASRSDRVSGGKTTSSRSNSRQGSQRSFTDEGLEEDADASSSSRVPLTTDGSRTQASDELDHEDIVGSPISRHHRSIAGSSDSLHESFPETLALATAAAGGAGVLYDPALDEATASMARAQAEENASCANSSVGLNPQACRVTSIPRSRNNYPQGVAAENQFLDSIGLHFTLRPDYGRVSLNGVKESKELEKRRRNEMGAHVIQSFMPRRSISLLETGPNTKPTRVPTPLVSSLSPSTPAPTPVGSTKNIHNTKSGSSSNPFTTLAKSMPTLGSLGLGGGGGTKGQAGANNSNTAAVNESNSLAPSSPHQGRTLPFRDAPVPTACAEYIARIKGPEVDDCRCTESQFCSNATSAPVENADATEQRVELGDVYVTQSGYSIVVCPPPIPKPKSTTHGSHGSGRD